jgi:hypothetical protein
MIFTEIQKESKKNQIKFMIHKFFLNWETILKLIFTVSNNIEYQTLSLFLKNRNNFFAQILILSSI